MITKNKKQRRGWIPSQQIQTKKGLAIKQATGSMSMAFEIVPNNLYSVIFFFFFFYVNGKMITKK
jgi:hypothetical protein